MRGETQVIVVCCLAALIVCGGKDPIATGKPAGPCVPKKCVPKKKDQATPEKPSTDGDEVVYLSQGWGKGEREDFYYTTQGSQLVPWDWFLALEQVDSENLFRDDSYLAKMGFIPQPKSMKNEEGLPIGFVLDDNPSTVRANVFAMKKALLGPDYKIEDYPLTNQWLGLTCAACHTNDIHHKGTVVRIDGGASLSDFETFQTELAAALHATHADDDKFTDFAKRVAENTEQPYQKIEAEAMRKRMVAYTGTLKARIARNHSKHRYGYARLDAFGAIFNQVLSGGLEIPSNSKPANAPVSYPFLWDTPELHWVQWNSSGGNPISRNIGEVLGVFAHAQLTGTPAEGQFTSTANALNLLRLETMIAKLSAPEWPEKHFKKPDVKKVRLGRKLYAANCTKCHSIRGDDGKFPLTLPNIHGKQYIRTISIPVYPRENDKAGTDPLMVTNFLSRTAETGAMKDFIDGKPDVARAAEVLVAAVSGVVKRTLAELPLDADGLLEITGHRDLDNGDPPPQVLLGYKARPLNGVWATAPFLHNGSVANLCQLLLPAKRRLKEFYVGSREFDTVNVGFETKFYPGGFLFRTVDDDGQPIPGNANSGHEGPRYTETKGEDGEYLEFTHDERQAIVEYMKTLK